MAEWRGEGVVVRQMDYRERDRIVTLLTAERGRVDLLARGAKASRRRFGGHLELFNRVRVQATGKEGASLWTLKSADAKGLYPALRADLVRFAVASYTAELALRTSVADQADQEGYAWLTDVLGSLDTLEGEPASWPLELARLGLALLALRGVLPDWGACVRCGARPGASHTRLWLTAPELVPLCTPCGAGRGPGGWVPVPALRAALGVAGAPHPDQLGQLAELVQQALETLVGGPLRSASFLAGLLATSDP